MLVEVGRVIYLKWGREEVIPRRKTMGLALARKIKSILYLTQATGSVTFPYKNEFQEEGNI